jgi:Zn-dependent M28 family amino/carboxypeptidase
MKYLIFIFLIAITLSTKAQTIFVDSIITEQSLKAHVSTLAHDSMQGRLMNTSGNRLAEEYIIAAFRKIGLKKTDPQMGYSFPISFNQLNYGNNIVGAIKGTDSVKSKQFIIFSAHYDHIGTSIYNISYGSKKSRKEDTINNGANDNATGVAALIELASYYNKLKKNEYTILFVAFNAQEVGLKGSTYFVEKIAKQKVKLVINLEMLGRSKNQKTSLPFITGKQNKDFITQLNTNLKKMDPAFNTPFFINDKYPDENLESRSDNFPFNKKDIPAYTIMLTSPNDKYCHSVDDELETIDFATMQQVVKGIALACQAYLQ